MIILPPPSLYQYPCLFQCHEYLTLQQFIDVPPLDGTMYNLTKEEYMAKKGFTPEQIINKLREAELQLQQGATITTVSKSIGVSSHTYYRWRKEYGGLRVDRAKKLKTLEKENARLKKLVADLSLDNAILKEASEGNY
jgi:putative transposase